MRKRWGRPAAAAAAAGRFVSCSVREKGRIGVPVRDGRGDRGGISGRRKADGISLSALSLRIGRGAAVRTAKNRASDMRYDNYCYFCGVRKPIRDRRFGRFRPPVGGYGNG